jgi:hypothetical protein
LFVLAQAGETVTILNNSDFRPKNWWFKGDRVLMNNGQSTMDNY